MKKINRNAFLHQSIKAGALVALSPFANSFFTNAQTSQMGIANSHTSIDESLLKRLIKANDEQVAKLLSVKKADNLTRKIGFDFALLVASYCTKDSAYYQSAQIIPLLDAIVDTLLGAQVEDGTVSIGNLESPPDTAFILEPLCSAMQLLKERKYRQADSIVKKLGNFITNAGEALKTGGIHTPNHRWVVSAALAQINELFPSKHYVARIDEWLREGIFQDKDGHYPERSMTYSFVENNAFLTMSRLLDRPNLMEPVRKNLEMTYYYMEPDGSLVTTDSRRQDQYTSKNHIVSWYLMYRYMAIKDGNGKFAAIAKIIESHPTFQDEIINKSLFYFLENPILQKELPSSTEMPVTYEKLFTSSSLARIRRGNTSATIFGGVDWPMIIASGRSNSPNIFSYRKGNAVLKYLRLSSSFFSMGYFYSNGLKKENDQYLLQNKLQVPYYQPMPKKLLNDEGDYALSPSIDGRFWNKMAFDKRPTSNIKNLDTKLAITEKNGKTELNFSVTGMKGVQVTIELCFKEGGQLKGIESSTVVNDNLFLEKGEARYEYNGDVIHFGPGKMAHKKLDFLEGEQYSTHFGSLRTDGMHVYLTGITPFEHQLFMY